MRWKYAFLVILMMALVGFFVWVAGGTVLYYVDFPSLMLILFPPLFIALTVFGRRSIAAAYSAFFVEGAKKKELLQAQQYFQSMERYVWLSALFGIFVGIIAMLFNVGTAEALAQGFATLLISVFYAVIAQMIFVAPFSIGIKRKLLEFDE